MIDQMSRANYERAAWKAFLNQIKSWITGRNNSLLPFDEVQARLPIAGQHYRGLVEVPLAQITGSVGRYRDFDRAFLPRQKNTKYRWLNIDKAYYQDIKLPPVELYKVGEIYFVKDGNHRVSVAREREQEYIDAYVIEIETYVPITPDSDLDELIRRAEQADFAAKSNLHQLRPDHEIRLTLPGQYEKLLEHIHVHRWFLGIEQEREIPWEEAVESWYDRVYLPLVTYIREQGILEHFPHRTESDLYLWIIEHRSFLRGDPEATPVEEAATDFINKRSERRSRRALRALKNTIKSLGLFAEEIVHDDLVVGGLISEQELAPAEESDKGDQAGPNTPD